MLDGAGALSAFPRLADLYHELNDMLGDEDVVGDLVDQIEGDPDGVWLALQGLGAIEREIRPSIIDGLARAEFGPGLVEFLRLLAYAHDPLTRTSALELLTNARAGVADALRDLSENHPDPQIMARLRHQIGAPPRTGAPPDAPRIIRSVVSAVDARGRGTIVLAALRGRDHVTAVFGCDVASGIHDVFGDVAASPDAAANAYDDLAGNLNGDVVENDHPLALGLLAASLTLCGPDASPALRYWIEATAGRDLRPRPFPAGPSGWNPEAIPFEDIPRRAQLVLHACPDWRDAAPLTFEIAEEILLRERSATVDPRRDAGAFRFLFEHRLKSQLERYRRMLLWMAGLWRSAREEELAESALTLAWQLADAQHVVPGPSLRRGPHDPQSQRRARRPRQGSGYAGTHRRAAITTLTRKVAGVSKARPQPPEAGTRYLLAGALVLVFSVFFCSVCFFFFALSLSPLSPIARPPGNVLGIDGLTRQADAPAVAPAAPH